MKSKSENPHLNELKNKFDKTMQNEIEKNIALIDAAIKNPKTNEYDNKRLNGYLVALKEALSKNEYDQIEKLFANKSMKMEDRIKNCVIIINAPFEIAIKKFFSIIKTDDQLKSFFSDPYPYIYNNPNKHSYYELQFLQNLTKNSDFYTLLGMNKPETPCLTKLSYKMYELGIWDYTNKRPIYGSTDAIAFAHVINPEVKKPVLEREKKVYHGPKKTVGYGAEDNYTYETIKQTAEMVKREERGACHTFAQLGAAKLLEEIQKGEFPGMHFKIVSHQAALGSHTFLLVEHNNKDINDLSNCIIIDPWAVAMGYSQSYGVFTLDNYPLIGMTSNLKCCFDSKNPNPSLSKATSANVMDELKNRVSTVSMFNEPKLKQNQQLFINFIGDLKKHVTTSLHQEVLDLLIDRVTETKHGSKEFYYNITKLAILVLHAQILEKEMDGKYKINKGKIADPEVLQYFPEKVVGVINDLLGKDKDTPLTSENLTELAKKIHGEEKDPLNFSNNPNFVIRH